MNGGNGQMAGMAERRKEWQNGRMAEMATYVLFTVHTDDDDDTDDDDTLIFYSIDNNILGDAITKTKVLVPPLKPVTFFLFAQQPHQVN